MKGLTLSLWICIVSSFNLSITHKRSFWYFRVNGVVLSRNSGNGISKSCNRINFLLKTTTVTTLR
uniref:Secreted protein n=1 Tax=Lepeophtheirus salmonis TaxID=72036 RepID=A0A0K2V309_LEPSM